MSCFSEDASNLFKEWNHEDIRAQLELCHSGLLTRRVYAVEYGEPDKLSPQKRTSLNCQVLRQALLHRAERLIVSSGVMLSAKNVYGLALLARGHLETTAVLAYFCNRIDLLSKGDITFERFALNVSDAVMGSKHDLFSKANAPPSIMTCIEKGDKFIRNTFSEKKDVLKDCYSWLSEYAHPNFLSNSTAFRVEQPNGRLVFHHENELHEGDFQLLDYFAISAELFLILFDRLKDAETATLTE